MKFFLNQAPAIVIFVILTVCFCDLIAPAQATAQKDEIKYSISINKTDPKLAKVKVTFRPKDNILYMNAGGGQLPKRWATFVRNLNILDEKGNSVTVKELPDAKWEMDLPVKQRVVLSYEIKLDHEDYKWSGGIDGVAFARDWGVFYSGRTLLILNGESWKDIDVEFNLPENWKVTTPWQPLQNQANSFRVNNLAQLANSLIFTGTHEEISVKRNGFELAFALGGDEIVSQKAEFKNLAEGVLDYYIHLMGGVPNPSLENKFKKAVVIINSSDATDGEVIGNNISILVEKNGDKTSKLFSRFIFAHEFFHLWNGKSFSPANDETEWFKEGFTNYYTLKALHHVGFLTDESFFEVLNSLFYQRYKTDDGVGKIPLTKGEEKHDHWGLIYGGGMFAGIAQDMIIRKATRNRKSLDDLMKGLFKKYGGSKDGYSLAELQHRLSELSGTSQAEFFSDFIVGTKRLPIADYFKIAGLDAEIKDGNLALLKKGGATDLQKSIFNGMLGRRTGSFSGIGKEEMHSNDVHTTTDWSLKPSFKFDVICFLNALTADPYYMNIYKEEFGKFEKKLTPPAETALANLKRKIKDEDKGIISAFLTLYFSATDDETLDQMLLTLKDSRRMQASMKQTQFYDEESWRLFESVKDDLRVIFRFLQKIQFQKYWQEHILPKVQARITEVEGQLPKFNIIPAIENILGFALPSNKISVFMLYYSRPHGIRITGTRFLTDVGYPFSIVMRNAIHEMMHPPFDLKSDTELLSELNKLQSDEFLMNKVLNHDPAFGYNSFIGFVEEDVVQALEQVINEKMTIGVEAPTRWKGADNGMHVLAVALYSLMKDEKFSIGRESARDFVIRMIRTRKLGPGKIKSIYEAFYR